jgi:hypothetical protein
MRPPFAIKPALAKIQDANQVAPAGTRPAIKMVIFPFCRRATDATSRQD